MAAYPFGHVALAMVTALALSGCQDGAGPLGPASPPATEAGSARAATSVKLVDRDVEAPQVFQTTDQALWDGRPSLGGVWVASPDATDPERVILRNPANGKFVIGALFRRERDNPGPKLQISSDAAAALGLLAGAPAQINVTALRREEAPVEEPGPDATRPILDAAETVETEALDPIAAAGAAIDKAEATATAAAATATAPQTPAKPQTRAEKRAAERAARAEAASAANATATTPGSQTAPGASAAPAPVSAAPIAAAPTATAPAAPSASGGLIQIGIFSVEANAGRAVDTLAKAGVTATIRKEESQGKTFWSVTARGDSAALSRIKSAGFADAYVLKR